MRSRCRSFCLLARGARVIARVTVRIGCEASWSGAIAAEPAGNRGGVYIRVTQIADKSVVLALTPNEMTNIVITSFQL